MDNLFNTLYNGSLKGLITQELFDRFFNSINVSEQWYEIITTSHDYELKVINGQEVKKHIENYINKIEEKGHHKRYDWFYADTVDSPRMLKIYNPLLCGCSGDESPMAWVIFTTVKPTGEELKLFKKSTKKEGIKEKIMCKIRDIKSIIH
jgi:hypothetical protein